MEKKQSDRSYFDLARNTDSPAIDEVTAGDIDLDAVFAKTDRSRTSPGQALLYCFLRLPATGAGDLAARLPLLDLFRQDRPLAARCAKALAHVGFEGAGDLVSEIWAYGGMGFEAWRRLFYAWLCLAPCIFAAAIFAGPQGGLLILGLLIVNIIIYSKTTSRISARAASIFYLCRLIRGGGELGRILKTRKPALDGQGGAILERLLSSSHALRRLPRQAIFFKTGGSNITGDFMASLLEYLRVFLLSELLAYFRVYSAFEKQRDEIVALYETLGRVDASLAVATLLDTGSLAETEGRGCPVVPATLVVGRRGIDFADLVHPLVEGCVPNSLCIDKGIVLTGTNMAGKSTFLKALALSQAFASGLGLAFAREYVCGYRLVVSSMTNPDDLLGGRSRYLVEAERILSILRKADTGCLAVIDEILVGTNSEDRIAASIRILFRLAKGPSLAVAATHDLPIAHGLETEYDLHHFSESLGGADLSFDYKLKPGIVDKKNALRILKQLGFDDEILGI